MPTTPSCSSSPRRRPGRARRRRASRSRSGTAGPALRRRPGGERHRDPRAHAERRHAGRGPTAPPEFGYQWLRCNGADCQEIAGATTDAYVLTAADKGFSVTVVVTAANAWGSASAQAAPTAPVAAAPPVNTSLPVIQSPEPADPAGQTLTVGRGRLEQHARYDLPPGRGSAAPPACAGRSAAPPVPSTRCSPRTSAPRSWRSAPPRTATARSPPAPPRRRWRP